MFASAEKSTPSAVRHGGSEGTFFRKPGESFFGSSEGATFFPAAVQAKLEVSHPDDPQEKEADSVADHVMRMPDPAPAAAAAPEEKEKEKVHRKAGAMIHRQEGAGGFASNQAQEETPAMGVQAKGFGHAALPLQCRARGPPSAEGASTQTQSSAVPFEQSLSSTKGAGSALPGDTRQFMESRFGADFSAVRIHTGSQAEALSRGINAQAFTHGGDIYFNSGKFSPQTAQGASLLAHELTHTIQQGASHSRPGSLASRSIQRSAVQRQVQRSAEGQRNAAVELAKAEQGKVVASHDGPDGFRMGWERLLEYFKTTFGADKILPSGTSGPLGTVNEDAIKTRAEVPGDKMDSDGKNVIHGGTRDCLPSWCGIFAFWALNKGGIPLPKWTIGKGMIPPEAVYPKGYQPVAGDLAYRQEFSHYALVVSSDGTNVVTVNGNTAGEDNVGGEIQVHTHPMAHWFAFFNPTGMMDGALRDPGAPDAPGAAPAKSLKDMQKHLRPIPPPLHRKAEGETAAVAEEKQEGDEKVQAKGETEPAGAAAGDAPAEGGGSGDAGSDAGNAAGSATGSGAGAASGGGTSGSSDGAGAGALQRSVEKDPGREESREPEAAGPVAARSLQRLRNGKDTLSPSPAPETPAPSGSASDKEDRKDEGMPPSPGPVQRLPMSLHNRGPPRAPPVLTKINRKLIQRSWIGDAWDAVTDVVSEAASWVAKGLAKAKDWIFDKIRSFVINIPGYRMLCLILGSDPITSEEVPMTGANLLEAGLDLLPGGSLFKSLMDRLGIFNDVAQWLQGRLDDLGSLASGIAARFSRFFDSLSLSDIGDPDGVLDRVASLFHDTIVDIVDFIGRSAEQFLEMIKKVMVREIAAFVRNKIPHLYPLLTVALGFDPETMLEVKRNGTNILNALLEVSETGRDQRAAMKESGTFQKIAGFIDEGISVFSRAYQMLKSAIAGIWDFVTIHNLFHPVDTFTRIWNTFAEPVKLVADYVIKVAKEIIRVIKKAILGRLSKWCEGKRGYRLICVVIGQNPVTGEDCPFTMENVIGGFMSLMEGGEEQFQQLKQSGAIDKLVDKITAAVNRLNMTPRAVIQLFLDLWNSVHISDLVHPIDLFERIVRAFGAPILRLIRFVIEIVLIVIEGVLMAMNFPFDLIANIIAKARLAWELIKRDPAGFFKNLLRAIKQGFIQFFDNILKHLWNGLKAWFLGEVEAAGIPIPTDFTVIGIIKWLLVVLGITMEKIWKKLEDRIGKEKVDKIKRMIDTAQRIAGAAGEAIQFIKDVRERGFLTVIGEKIMEKLSDAWNMVLGAVQSFVMDQIIKKITVKLLSMLDPTGIMAVVNSAIALYKAIQSFIRYLRQMLEIVNSFVEGTLEIAQGNIQKAADFLEGSLARAIPIAIGFFANQVGLNLSERLKDALEIVREKVDAGLTWVIDKLVTFVERLVEMGRSAVAAVQNWLGLRKDFPDRNGVQHHLYFQGTGAAATLIVESTPTPIDRILTDIGTKVGEPANAQYRPQYDQAVVLNGEINTLKGRLADDSNYPGGTTGQVNPAKQADSDQLNSKMTDMVAKLGDLLPLVGGPTPPPAVLPAFVDGVTASPVNAMFISKTTPGGQDASANNGATLPGWGELNRHNDPADATKTIRERDNYVKMHMLHDALGGMATDSNLAPTKSSYNTQFYNAVESFAVADKATSVIWYEVTMSFWGSSGPVAGIDYSPYPRSFSGKYGLMEYNGGQWAKGNSGAAKKTYNASSIPVPDFAGGDREYEMNSIGATTIATMTDGARTMPESYAAIIALERTEAHDTGRHRKYASYPDMKSRLKDREAVRSASGYPVGENILSALKAKGKLKFN